MRPWAALACVAVTAAAAPHFEQARVCSLCHSKITAARNENVAPYALWTGSMKANSARDPYWRAKVREETTVNPSAAALIEDKCLRCHAPAQQYTYRGAKTGMRLADLNMLGEDGVTCTVCHQIRPDGLGTPASFTAGFRIGDDEKVFGPHANPFAMPMVHHTGYKPVESKHVLDSALCGSCHTVITPTLDENGKTVGEFVEQAPYLEWLASDFAREGQTCQSCHMPRLETASYIAHFPAGGSFPPTRPRQPFGRHVFAAANVRGAEMLSEILPERGDSFEAAATRGADMLSRSLALSVNTSWARTGVLEISVDVENLSGHKLPTAYPSRRLWLHVTALDGGGRALFESGAWDRGTGELVAKSDQPHYARITSADQVMVYETEHADSRGRPTTSLLRAARYVKDNRILPRGFKSEDARIAPAGIGSDSDFTGGRDRVVYEVHAARGVKTVVVEAWYQSIKPAHARATTDLDNADTKRFGFLYSRHHDPVRVASVEVAVANPK